MKVNKIQFAIWLAVLIGSGLGVYMVGRAENQYFYEIAMAIVGGTLIGFLLYFFGQKKKRNIPDMDERSIRLMQKYLLGVLYVLLFGGAGSLIILYFMGIYTIEVGMLMIIFLCLIMLIGIGALIAKRL
ncbi:hypothetical protein [Bacillus sp. 1P06AnD]|uniref:hypothetical protein n=1 Tax=Bacillus sp. 1P06AnD TaxID=3132208 RepID=UPI0039A0B53D